jgi:hypothetical protein
MKHIVKHVLSRYACRRLVQLRTRGDKQRKGQQGFPRSDPSAEHLFWRKNQLDQTDCGNPPKITCPFFDNANFNDLVVITIGPELYW